jgi:hypothetical protein
VFRIERHDPEFLARRISGVAIFPCEGGRDEAGERALGAAFDKGGERGRAASKLTSRRLPRKFRHSDLSFRRRTMFPFASSDAEENNPSTVRISSQRDRKRWVRLAITGCLIGR